MINHEGGNDCTPDRPEKETTSEQPGADQSDRNVQHDEKDPDREREKTVQDQRDALETRHRDAGLLREIVDADGNEQGSRAFDKK